MRIGRTAVVVACASLLIPASASAAQHVVDDDRLECPSAGYTTIAAAVAAAQPGDTISVCHGVYREGPSGPGATSLTIDKSLTIKGEGAGRVYVGPTGDLAASPANLRDSAGNIISVVGAEVNISGITVFGSNRHVEAGIHYLNSDGVVSSVEIVDMVRAGMYDGVTGVGYFAWGNTETGRNNVAVQDSLIENYDAAGIVIDAALANGGLRTSTSGANGLFAVVSENRITGAGAGGGIGAQDGYRVLNRASTVAIDNAITDNSDAGIDVFNAANTSQTRFNRNNIQRNRIGFRHEGAFAVCTNDAGRTNRFRLDAVENWWGSPLGPSTDDLLLRGDAVSGSTTVPTGCTSTQLPADSTDRLTYTNYLLRPAPVPTPLGLFVDRQPTVDVTASASTLVPDAQVTITAAAADDIGVKEVTFLRGDEVLAVDKEAPYQATFTPNEEQAWTSQSIVAVVTDSRGQTGGDAISLGASEDEPPFIELLRPERRDNGAFRLEAVAVDDREVKKVTFFLDGERECVDREAPYTCRVSPEFVPRDRLTVVAIATDSAGQTSTDLGKLRLPNKLKPKSLSLHADANRNRVFADGRLKLPRTVDDRDGCEGKVEVEVRRGGDVVESEKVRLDRDCEYAVAIRAGRDGNYRVRARFLGNDLLRPISAEPEEVTVG
jgi:hypothetical protein